jgi:bifunctional non-homologous end joining protein LigD
MLRPHIPFFPMEPMTCPKPFDDAGTGFQIKWDGVRILAHIKDGRVELYNRKKNIRTRQYPEVAFTLAGLINHDLILDGEMVALKGGKPSFPQLIRRDFAVDTSTVRYLCGVIPVTYVIFDILYNNGHDLTEYPFSQRDELLKSLIPSKDPIVVTDTIHRRGTTLFSVAKSAELEGIVAKKLDSPYRIAKKSSDWLKIKNRRSLTALIGGYFFEGREVRSLFLGVFQDKDFIYVGRAGSGLNRQSALLLLERLQGIKTNRCHFTNPPEVGKREVAYWVNPSIEVMIEYMDFTDEGYVRHPVIKQVML